MDFAFPLPATNLPNTLEWVYNGTPVTESVNNSLGFVYCITNKLTGKKYIGKKQCLFKRSGQQTVVLKSGVKKKKKVVKWKDSDWREYYGSNDHLKADIEANGKENFSREILVWCQSLGEMSYIESWYIFSTHAMLRPDEYYNGWCMVRVSASHLKNFVENHGVRQS